LIAKDITYEMLKEAIDVSFENDYDIISMYDPSVEVYNLSDVANSIYKKLFELKDIVECKGTYHKDKLMGYYIYIDSLLISFGINKKYRVPKHLDSFFELIKKDLGEIFICRLWDTNIRGIKWLVKKNMQIADIENNIVTLIFKK
jgi:hypothetical protein